MGRYIEVGGERYTLAQVVSRNKVYRFDLNPQSLPVVAVRYESFNHWVFYHEVIGEVTYTADELRTRIKDKRLWIKL